MKTLNLSLLFFIALTISSCTSSSLTKLSNQKNHYSFTTEKMLKDSVVLGRIDSLFSSRKLQYFKGKEGANIAYKIFLQDTLDRGAIVISSGRTECMVKYSELIYDLYKNGFSVYILDHRGQGFSSRMTADPEMGYVKSFQFYIDDLKTFYDLTLSKRENKNIYLLGHSMGGAIGLTYLEEFPNDFKKAAFSSPMLGLAFLIEELIGFLYDEETIEYAIGNKGYKESIKTFEQNKLTNSKIRYDRFLKVGAKNPTTVIGGATYHWVYNSCLQFKVLFENINQIQIPFILFSGTEDKVVSTSAHDDFIKRSLELHKNAIGYKVENSKHEAFIEKDKVRVNVLTRSLDFFLE